VLADLGQDAVEPGAGETPLEWHRDMAIALAEATPTATPTSIA
jgi:hypothetical protein